MFIWQINYVCMYVENFPNWEPKAVCFPILNQSPLISWFAANSHRLIWAKNTGILSKTAKFFRGPYSLDPRSRECIPTSLKKFYGGNLIFQPWAQMHPLSRTVLPIFPTRKSWICYWLVSALNFDICGFTGVIIFVLYTNFKLLSFLHKYLWFCTVIVYHVFSSVTLTFTLEMNRQ